MHSLQSGNSHNKTTSGLRSKCPAFSNQLVMADASPLLRRQLFVRCPGFCHDKTSICHVHFPAVDQHPSVTCVLPAIQVPPSKRHPSVVALTALDPCGLLRAETCFEAGLRDANHRCIHESRAPTSYTASSTCASHARPTASLWGRMFPGHCNLLGHLQDTRRVRCFT